MKKKIIKMIIAEYGYKMIGPSWHHNSNYRSALFAAYDENGMVYQFYISDKHKRAERTMMTDIDIRLEPADISYMFFKEV